MTTGTKKQKETQAEQANGQHPVKPELINGQVPKAVDDIGRWIKAEWARGTELGLAAVESRLNIGVALNRARKAHRSNKAFGDWLDNQKFPFGTRQANNLQRMGANKAKMLRAVKAQIAAGEDPNYTKALAVVEGKATAESKTPPASKEPPSGNGVPDNESEETDLRTALAGRSALSGKPTTPKGAEVKEDDSSATVPPEVEAKQAEESGGAPAREPAEPRPATTDDKAQEPEKSKPADKKSSVAGMSNKEEAKLRAAISDDAAPPVQDSQPEPASADDKPDPATVTGWIEGWIKHVSSLTSWATSVKPDEINDDNRKALDKLAEVAGDLADVAGKLGTKGAK